MKVGKISIVKVLYTFYSFSSMLVSYLTIVQYQTQKIKVLGNFCYLKPYTLFFYCLDIHWQIFYLYFFLQFHICIPCILTTLASYFIPALFTLLPNNFFLNVHLSLSLCDPHRLSWAIVQWGVELFFGTWWTQQRLYK